MAQNYPFGAADVQAMTATGTQALTIKNQLTIIDGVTTQSTSARTINLTIDSQVKSGAIIHVLSKHTGTETCTFGTGMKGTALTGVAGKTLVTSFMYNGTSFYALGAFQQVD